MENINLTESSIPSELAQEMEAIGDMLDTALEYQFEVEVIYWALTYMKQDPTVTPAQAFALGIAEWIK